MNVRQCKKCEQYFGTVSAYEAHRGKRGCLSSKSLNQAGYWQGHSDVWWSSDLGHDDTPADWFRLCHS